MFAFLSLFVRGKTRTKGANLQREIAHESRLIHCYDHQTNRQIVRFVFEGVFIVNTRTHKQKLMPNARNI